MGLKENIKLVRAIIPPLKESFHKGQAGRVAVFGGCEDYTGAPFFSCLASMIVGADMGHIVCAKEASTPIKAYSPDVMVHPYLQESTSAAPGVTAKDLLPRATSILDRVHVIVVGPGMGRDKLMIETVTGVIEAAKEKNLHIVIDADGLFLVQNNPDVIKGYKRAVLTPNVMEFKRLQDSLGLKPQGEDDVTKLAQAFGGVTILQKGQVDRISNGSETLVSDIQGGLKRVGGQGDTLSGSLATFLAWKKAYQDNLWEHSQELAEDKLMTIAAFGASSITRKTSRLAYEAKGRAMLTSDLSKHLGDAYTELYGNDSKL
ncbi:ATP-dependent (S)-NAD(P)H-hydrate dehydratase [Yarrowia sp. C11]|nr:ATP-dependent (S)-NAD(P)H-hydrate dehydratase [Yarrowia sp. E02]KAG5369217.1 ATP-dependent (S)-NAD(P)H-hydrate dehydratase [Yarrowia sp. C11]